MKFLRKFEELEMKVTTSGKTVLLTAKIIGTDGMVYDELHTVEFAQITVTKRSVHARWTSGQAIRPNLIGTPAARTGPARTVTVPRVFSGPTARKNLVEIRHRLVFLLAPQHGHMFGTKEAQDFCADLHGYIVVNDVMSS